MGIYYYKLWDMLESRNITQRELIENLHLSTATLTKMRKNQTVSMETIDLIREYLGCDYGDMITAEPMAEGVEFNWQGEGVATKTNEVYRIALIEYMETQSLTPQTVADITTLSLNTVKSFIKGKTLSSRSLVKLMRLGSVYNARVGELLTEYDVRIRSTATILGAGENAVLLMSQLLIRIRASMNHTAIWVFRSNQIRTEMFSE